MSNNKRELESLFGGKHAEEYNAMMTALLEASEGKEKIYNFMENTPKTSFVAELTDALHAVGYKIIKKE